MVKQFRGKGCSLDACYGYALKYGEFYASSYYGSRILAADGIFMNLYDVDNLDTTRDYWSQYYI